MVFVDESGFSLVPSVRRTWAPIGQTPILRHVASWKNLSAISGVTLQPNLYMLVYPGSIRAPRV
ncbi:MAG: transposase, partial [Bacteroidota bacterium]